MTLKAMRGRASRTLTRIRVSNSKIRAEITNDDSSNNNSFLLEWVQVAYSFEEARYPNQSVIGGSYFLHA